MLQVCLPKSDDHQLDMYGPKSELDTGEAAVSGAGCMTSAFGTTTVNPITAAQPPPTAVQAPSAMSLVKPLQELGCRRLIRPDVLCPYVPLLPDCAGGFGLLCSGGSLCNSKNINTCKEAKSSTVARCQKTTLFPPCIPCSVALSSSNYCTDNFS